MACAAGDMMARASADAPISLNMGTLRTVRVDLLKETSRVSDNLRVDGWMTPSPGLDSARMDGRQRGIAAKHDVGNTQAGAGNTSSPSRSSRYADAYPNRTF